MDESSDLSDDIVQDEPFHSPFERKFFPWHKVRKEYVRREQWNKLVVRYAIRYLQSKLQRNASDDEWSADLEFKIPETVRIDRPLSCLVIPGDDLLDIRSLHRDTESIQCYIRYLGFNHGHGSQQVGTRLHVAHNDVTSLTRISSDSVVLHDPFQQVANQQSQAYRYVKQFGPFHVVNLDLCDSLFPNRKGNIEAYFEAIHGIAAFQMKEMAAPWLLFITTEIAPDEIDVEQFDRLCRPTKDNLLKHPSFAAAVASLVPTSAVNVSANQKVDCARLSEQQLIDLFGIALGKALLSFCSSAAQKWKVQMLGSHVYSINPVKNVSMLSLAFQFSPLATHPVDATGLSSLKLDSSPPFDELDLAKRLVNAVRNITNIDKILRDDSELHTALFESSANLLSVAGYDRNAYVNWVNNGEQ